MADRSPAASSPAPSRPVLRSRPLQPIVPASRAPSGPNSARLPGADGGSPSVRTVVPMTTVRPARLDSSSAANTSALISFRLHHPLGGQAGLAPPGHAAAQHRDPGEAG